MKLQFGLRWFLLTTTLIAVLIGTVGKRTYNQWQNNVALERRARVVQELQKNGVKLESRGDDIVRVWFPYGQVKARYFQLAAEIEEVEDLRLSRTGFTDSDAPTLDPHPKLHELWLSGNPGVTDEALKSVAEIRSLQTLELGETQVTSRGLVHLRPLQSLMSLGLANTSIDDSGVEEIGKLRNLQIILLSRTKVHGPGLVHLARLPNMMLLQLDGCSLQDGRGLAELKQVTRLRIWDAQISPGVLSHIHQMESLRHLDLGGSAINDQHLVELANATQLTSLSLERHEYPHSHKRANDLNPNLSAAALNELRAKLPNTRIYGEPRNR